MSTSLITDLWDTTVIYGGHRYRTNAAFDTVLAVQQLYKDKDVLDTDKVTQALRMLLCSPLRSCFLSYSDQVGLLEEIFQSQIVFDKRSVKPQAQKVLDFELDGAYIYASFYQDYGLDLIELQGKLHWKKFLALFQGLSDETKIKQIMKIRSMEVPAPTKHNQKQIQSILELKSYYALPVSGGGGQEGLDRLFSSLERMVDR